MTANDPIAVISKIDQLDQVILLRLSRALVRFVIFEIAALLGVIAYVFLPPSGGQIVAGLVVFTLVAALTHRLVQVIRDPVGSVSWRSDR